MNDINYCGCQPYKSGEQKYIKNGHYIKAEIKIKENDIKRKKKKKKINEKIKK